MTITNVSGATAPSLHSTARVVAVPIFKNVLVQAGLAIVLLVTATIFTTASNPAHAQEADNNQQTPALSEVKNESPVPDSDLAAEMETLKQALVNLNRDLFILEEDLLFPSSTQVAVYLSMDVGEYFKLDAVELKIDGKLATNYLYTDRQVNALYKGGVQRLFVGNINQGSRELTAFFIGTGPENRPYKRAVTLEFEKDDEAATVELKIVDSTSKQQPTFSATLL
ncbi:hypothetical protein [Brumicola nitratireducens]|uniref:AraC family transcriptional regulator n=1 Tax=Glaciecola nitratireducens (strain JCM 12485 / KCTC 12276 / FR1064) TaxID=1085623 RepID=G4QP38_GLANF|nr:hypothetical protein [Glaciecola nitratireducens]AEP31746.1 hypothetical protein GNIT_3652 [Glaciecola nitratireducens FR1064]